MNNSRAAAISGSDSAGSIRTLKRNLKPDPEGPQNMKPAFMYTPVRPSLSTIAAVSALLRVSGANQSPPPKP
jgi:hypothetical protein